MISLNRSSIKVDNNSVNSWWKILKNILLKSVKDIDHYCPGVEVRWASDLSNRKYVENRKLSFKDQSVQNDFEYSDL